MSTPRDNQFAGAAKALLDDLLRASIVIVETPFQDDWREEWEQTITHFAYDLVGHTMNYVANPINWYIDGLIPETAAEVPDMPGWSDEE